MNDMTIINQYDQVSPNGEEWYLVLKVDYGYIQSTNGTRYSWNTQHDGRMKEWYITYFDGKFLGKRSLTELVEQNWLILKPWNFDEVGGVLKTIQYYSEPNKIQDLI